jgi:hypothetical protein
LSSASLRSWKPANTDPNWANGRQGNDPLIPAFAPMSTAISRVQATFEALTQLLAGDVRIVTDGGGKVRHLAATAPRESGRG